MIRTRAEDVVSWLGCLGDFGRLKKVGGVESYSMPPRPLVPPRAQVQQILLEEPMQPMPLGPPMPPMPQNVTITTRAAIATKYNSATRAMI